MIETLEVFTPGISTPPLPIGDGTPGTDYIQIRNITGLEPVKAEINTTPYGSVDGVSFDGASTPSRNIVLTVGLNPDWANQTIEGLRAIVYSYFLPQNKVRLRFTSTHMATVEIVGYVETCEPSLFVKDSEFQISIICPQPYFVALDESSVDGVTGALTSTAQLEVDYQGNVPTGFVVDFSVPGSTPFTGEVRIVNFTPTTQLFIVQATIDTTKSLSVSTVERDKFARNMPLPTGTPVSILGKVQPGSVWLPLAKGTNLMQFLTATAGQNFTLRWFAKYGGL